MRYCKFSIPVCFLLCGLAWQLDGCSATPGSRVSAADSPPSTPAPESGDGTDGTDDGASSPQPVTGAYLVDCGYAGANGYGCVVQDASSGAKTKAAVQAPVVTVTYSGGTVSKPAVTTAPATDPWSVYFQPAAGMGAAIQSIALTAGLVTGQSTLNLNATAQSLTFIPGVTSVVPKATFAASSVILFVTNATFVPGGALASKSAGDQICASVASGSQAIVPPQGRTWHALLAVSTQPLSLFMTSFPADLTASLVNASGASLGTLQSLVSGILPTSIPLDETGHAIPLTDEVWTGATASGTPSAGATCSDWTSSSGNGMSGMLSNMAQWLSATTTSCSSAQHIYCVGY